MLRILTGENGDGSLITCKALAKTTTIKEIRLAFGLKIELCRLLAKRAKEDPAFAAALYGLYRATGTFFDDSERIEPTRCWSSAQGLLIRAIGYSQWGAVSGGSILTTAELVEEIEKLPPGRSFVHAER